MPELGLEALTNWVRGRDFNNPLLLKEEGVSLLRIQIIDKSHSEYVNLA